MTSYLRTIKFVSVPAVLMFCLSPSCTLIPVSFVAQFMPVRKLQLTFTVPVYIIAIETLRDPSGTQSLCFCCIEF
jgi:hypothetical protein